MSFPLEFAPGKLKAARPTSGIMSGRGPLGESFVPGKDLKQCRSPVREVPSSRDQ